MLLRLSLMRTITTHLLGEYGLRRTLLLYWRIQMANQMNFLITEDIATKEVFEKAGLQLIQKVGNSWLFLNDNNKLLFACEGETPLTFAYTNKMMF